jgi:ribonuclease R
VTALVGSGVFVQLDAPFVDVLVRYEDCGPERFELDDDGLRAVAKRSGEAIQLGDRMLLDVIDVAILRRSVYGRRVASAEDAATKRGEGRKARANEQRGKSKKPKARFETSYGQPKKKPGQGKKKKLGRR